MGKRYGQVFAYDYKYNKDADGNIMTNPDGTPSIVLAPNGVPARGDLTAFGTSYHPGRWAGPTTSPTSASTWAC
ncbi:MAG: hypothetical protein WKG07_50075 [Hymenobacter sp.]